MMDSALAEVRGHLYDLLLAPYTQLSPWAITKACVYLEHPLTPRGDRCICGKVKVAAREIV